MEKIKISIAILNYNGVHLLKKFLPYVIKYSDNREIYIIDNNSSDSSVKIIKTHFPNVNIVQNKFNFGYAKGYNEGLKSINSEIICLLNSDVEVTKNWINPIQEMFINDTNIYAIQPKILNYYKKNKFDYAGAAGGFIDKYGYPYCRGRIFNTIENDIGQYNDIKKIFWGSGACLFIKKKEFYELGGFDENLFCHMEEIDLCWRINNLNKKVIYCGLSTVYHIGGGTLNIYDIKKKELNYRNNLIICVKNIPIDIAIKVIIIRLFLDIIDAIYFIKSKGIRHSITILKSHIFFYRYLLKFHKKHKMPKNRNKYYSIKSIIIKYFILKKRIFSDL